MARKIVTVDTVKRLPIGTDVFKVKNATGEAARFWIAKRGRRKVLCGLMLEMHDIKDTPGWHYEVEVIKK